MKEQIDVSYEKAFVTSTRKQSLQAIDEVRYLENLYGDAIDYRSHVSRKKLDKALHLIVFFGLLLLAAGGATYMMEWALRLITKAVGF